MAKTWVVDEYPNGDMYVQINGNRPNLDEDTIEIFRCPACSVLISPRWSIGRLAPEPLNAIINAKDDVNPFRAGVICPACGASLVRSFSFDGISSLYSSNPAGYWEGHA